MIDIVCPHASSKVPVVMLPLPHNYSWLNGKPTMLIQAYKCPECGTIIRISYPVVYHSKGEGKHES